MSASVLVPIARPGTYKKYAPKVDSLLVVSFPGETMRVPIKTVVDPDTVIVQIDVVPMSKVHTFRLHDHVGARRRVENGRDIWEAQREREFLEEQARMLALNATPVAPPKKVAAPVAEAVAVAPPKPARKPAPKKQMAVKRVGKGKKRRAA